MHWLRFRCLHVILLAMLFASRVTAKPVKQKEKNAEEEEELPTLAHNRQPFGEIHMIGNSRRPSSLLVFAHGRGESGATYFGFAKELTSAFPGLLVALPGAPQRRLLRPGPPQYTPSWYIEGPAASTAEDMMSLVESSRYLEQVGSVLCKRHRIQPRNVFYGGVNQGGTVSFIGAMKAEVRPRGIINVNGGACAREHLRLAAKNNDVPMFVALPAMAKENFFAGMDSLGYKRNLIDYTENEKLNLLAPNHRSDEKATGDSMDRLKQWLRKHLPSK